jgi:hypothetical protein
VFRLTDLAELLRDGGTDDAGVEGGYVGADERREGARRAVGLYHVPQHRLLPLVELPVRVPPPEPVPLATTACDGVASPPPDLKVAVAESRRRATS